MEAAAYWRLQALQNQHELDRLRAQLNSRIEAEIQTDFTEMVECALQTDTMNDASSVVDAATDPMPSTEIDTFSQSTQCDIILADTAEASRMAVTGCADAEAQTVECDAGLTPSIGNAHEATTTDMEMLSAELTRLSAENELYKAMHGDEPSTKRHSKQHSAHSRATIAVKTVGFLDTNDQQSRRY